jgi:hypothetical protein
MKRHAIHGAQGAEALRNFPHFKQGGWRRDWRFHSAT